MLAEKLAVRVGKHGGAALIMDYGQDKPYRQSLVALRKHRAQHLLESPGTADVSAWVDFSALRQAAEESGAAVKVHGPQSQAQLLLSLGIEARLQQLEQSATAQQAEQLRSGFERITGAGEKGMGQTYKALCIAHESLAAPDGFS